MDQCDIEKRDGGYWIRGTRISLDSIVYSLKRGATPEGIQQPFPLLTPQEIEGVWTLYTVGQHVGTQCERRSMITATNNVKIKDLYRYRASNHGTGLRTDDTKWPSR